MTDDQLDQLLVLDARPGPALPIGSAAADALIDAALAGAGFGPAGGPGHGGTPSSSGTPSAGTPSAGTGSAPSGGTAARGVVGTKLVTATIALTLVVFVIAFLVGRHRAHQVAAAPPDAAPDAAVLAGGPALDAPAAQPPGDAAQPPGDAAQPPGDAAQPPAHATAPAIATPDADEIAMEPAPPPSPTHHAAAPAEPRAVNDLLGEANAKRAAHAWRESDALYARVVKRVPGTIAAQTALVASASLHLEHLGDARGAADRFRKALAIAPRGALAEEARWGLAQAARARHDDATEAKALDDFLAHHPESPHAGQARARRQELK